MAEDARVQYLLPCALVLILVAILPAMPWKRPHPNHLFMLDLLNAAIGDDAASGLESNSDQERKS